jgi:hypothetical protein
VRLSSGAKRLSVRLAVTSRADMVALASSDMVCGGRRCAWMHGSVRARGGRRGGQPGGNVPGLRGARNERLLRIEAPRQTLMRRYKRIHAQRLLPACCATPALWPRRRPPAGLQAQAKLPLAGWNAEPGSSAR